jgi:two-component system OmpR family response regulator
MRILLVEDEPEMAKLVRGALEKAGFVVDWAESIVLAAETAQSVAHDLVVLDRQLGDGDGTGLIALLRRRHPSIPILVLSALGTPSHRIEGLDLGADDYLAKPFVLDELVARIRALLRRPGELASQPLALGNLSLDPALGQVLVEKQPFELPRRELLILESLMRRAGRTVRRSLIEDEVYGADDEVQPNALESNISRLRRRLQDAGATVEVHTVRGIGYLVRAL